MTRDFGYAVVDVSVPLAQRHAAMRQEVLREALLLAVMCAVLALLVLGAQALVGAAASLAMPSLVAISSDIEEQLRQGADVSIVALGSVVHEAVEHDPPKKIIAD